MSLKEKISRFWNETLGVDCPEEVNILDSKNPEDQELKESLTRVYGLEKKYATSATSSSKAGKSSSAKVVDKVEVDSSKAVEKAEQKSTEQKSMDSKEER